MRGSTAFSVDVRLSVAEAQTPPRLPNQMRRYIPANENVCDLGSYFSPHYSKERINAPHCWLEEFTSDARTATSSAFCFSPTLT